MTIEKLLSTACRNGQIRALDMHIGLLMARLEEKHPKEIGAAAALTSATCEQGNLYLPIGALSAFLGAQNDPDAPDPETCLARLRQSDLVGQPGEHQALVLENDKRLYLRRYFRYEHFIADDLVSRAGPQLEVDAHAAGALLNQLFPATGDAQQKRVAAHALLKRLLIVSGGAGTGKTHTATRLLALLQALSPRPLSIELAAPTGKAAARLRESIQQARQSLPAELGKNLPVQAKTLHRLLGYRAHSRDFMHNQQNPLKLDVLLIDEASMVDISLMRHLLEALPHSTRLILLGDHNQLPSVEAGQLFADLCNRGQQRWSIRLADQVGALTGTACEGHTGQGATIDDCLSLLTRIHRQGDESSGIVSLSRAVLDGDPERLAASLESPGPGLDYIPSDRQANPNWLSENLWQGYRALFKATSLEEAFSAMEEFRVLCALNEGPAGVATVNRIALARAQEKQQVPHRVGLHYPGRPIIILANDYRLQLFNGDTGLLWEDPDDHHRLKAWFRHPDRDELFPVSPSRLPPHDSAYAITIHKSQGSEFDRVLLLLPDEENRILSRALLYTGVTRARTRLVLAARQSMLQQIISINRQRCSGLGERLRP